MKKVFSRICRLGAIPALSLLLACSSSNARSESSIGTISKEPPPANSQFSTDNSKVSFVTFGDWGSGSENQTKVADAIARYCAEEDCDFAVALGDNFYSKGVSSVEDRQWEEKFRDIYSFLQLPFYAILGNHDMDGNEQTQIDYSNVDDYWIMPGEDYAILQKDGDGRDVLELFAINTGDYVLQDNEATWLAESLAGSRAPWKILLSHVPLISNGEHGDASDGLQAAIRPVICGQNPTFILSGHDHHFAHLKESRGDCTIEQFVVGTGGADTRAADDSDPRAIKSDAFHGFGWFQASEDSLTFRMINGDGSVTYETTWGRTD